MINIIGAGPIGCYTAYLLAKQGKEVNLFEEHKEIGKPVQCTGIVTSSLKDIVKIKNNCIINTINTARIISPNNKYIDIKLKNKNIVLDRKKFDQYLAGKAKKAGANIFLNHKFLGKKENKIIIKTKNKIKKIESKILIGADGPTSKVAEYINPKRDFYIGIQARVRIKNNPDIFQVYLGKIAPNFFAWIVPENNQIARIGLAVKNNPSFYFRNFLKSKKIIEKQAGLIPIYNPKQKILKNNIYLVGDAATQIKAATGGGLVHGLLASKILSNCIIKNKDYEKECKKKIKKDLLISLKIRNILNNFTDSDYNRLIQIFSKDKNKKILEEFDRDYPSKFMTKLIINEPKLLYFAKNLF